MVSRAQRRAEVQARLFEIAHEHLAAHGAAALSVRAIARDLQMAPSALFRYISGRDELLTLLIVDCFTALADEVDRAVDTAPADDPSARWDALAHAMRDWAVQRPQQWALLYGSPVPDYHAPIETTTPSGTRVMGRLIEIAVLAQHAGIAAPAAVPGDGTALADAATRQVIAQPELADSGVAPSVVANGMAAWVMLIGAISNEVFEQFGPDFDAAEFFDYIVAAGRRILFVQTVDQPT